MVRHVQGRFRGLRGFTLIELTIVMLILVALAGVMVPLFGVYFDRAHESAAASNISQITRQVELFAAKYQTTYPDQFDNFATTGTIWTGDGVHPGISPAAAAVLSPLTLDAQMLASLNNAGITATVNTNAATDNATFHQYVPATDITPLTATSTVAEIVPANLPSVAYGLPNTDTVNYHYVLLGLGDNSTAIGTVMASAPVHYDNIDPKLYYQHYGLVFQVPVTGGTHDGQTAKLVAVTAIHDGGLSGLSDHINGYNQDVNSGN